MRNTTLLRAFVLLLLTHSSYAAPTDLPALDSKVRTLAAFKNGLGFVFRSGQTDLKDGWTVLGELPAAALGTLWIGTPPPARVEEVVSYKGKIARDAESISLEEILEANVGREASIMFVMSEASEMKLADGVILSAPKDRDPDPTNPALAIPDSSGRSVSAARGEIVTVRTSNGDIVAIRKNSVRAIKLPKDAPLTTSLEREVNSARIRVAGAKSRADITLAYLEKGITWSPSYLVNVADEKLADITLEAVLADDTEDLEDADVFFVVGYPNFMFADKLTPLYAQQSVAQFARSLQERSSETSSYGGYGAIMSQSMANSAGYSVRSEWRPETAYSAAPPLSGESNEDLYFYRQPHVTLKKGDRARYTVFTAKVPYDHVYTWNVPDSMNLDSRGYIQGNSRTSDQPAQQVWHALRLENTTKQPWTTAPAFTVNGPMPVAQDVMQYTPPTVRNSLKLTAATDVKAEQVQTEISRSQVKILGDGYDEVTVDGKLVVKNLKSKPIKMSITKSLTGQVVESSQGGKVIRSAKNLGAVNPQSDIEWEFELPAGGEQQLTYTYKILLHR